MPLKWCEVVSILLCALVSGVFWGPWVAVSRSFATFEPSVFLAIVHRMGQNIGPLMTFLMPIALLSTVPVLVLSYNGHPQTFYLTAAGLVLFIVALLVTLMVEVPLVGQMTEWTVATLPDNWRQIRDRWCAFHIVRVGSGIGGLACLVVGAVL